MFLACLPVCECGYCKKPAEKQNYAKEKKREDTRPTPRVD